MGRAGLVSANDSALNEGAFGPQPLDVSKGVESDVELVSESLVFHFGAKKTAVTARFHFRNTSSSKPVHQVIGFPDAGEAGRKGTGLMWNTAGPLEGLRSFVNRKERPSKLRYGYIAVTKEGWVPADKTKGDLMAWHVLELDFKPREEIVVKRRYLARHGVFPYWFSVFRYVAHTGSAWKGAIGSLKAEVILEDGLRLDDLEWKAGEDNAYAVIVQPSRDEWKATSDTRMELEWRDFEPSRDLGKAFIQLAIPSEISPRLDSSGASRPRGIATIALLAFIGLLAASGLAGICLRFLSLRRGRAGAASSPS